MAIRKVDKLGRLCIPKDMRELLELTPTVELDVVMKGRGIFIERYESYCGICGGTEKLLPLSKGHICTACASEMSSFSLAGATKASYISIDK